MMYNKMKNYYDKRNHFRSNTISVEQRPNSLFQSRQQSSANEKGRKWLNLSMLCETKKYSTVDYSTKIQKILISKAAEQAQETIKKQLKGQLCQYLIRKFKHILISKDAQETSSNDHQFVNPESRISKEEKCFNDRKECRGCMKMIKKQNISQQLKIAHTREKILRLIEMKHNKEKEFSEYQGHIKARFLKTEKIRHRNTYLEEKQNLEQNLKQNQQWARQRDQEILRYRARVMKKNQKYQNFLIFHQHL